jgi:hypothetical protein
MENIVINNVNQFFIQKDRIVLVCENYIDLISEVNINIEFSSIEYVNCQYDGKILIKTGEKTYIYDSSLSEVPNSTIGVIDDYLILLDGDLIIFKDCELKRIPINFESIEFIESYVRIDDFYIDNESFINNALYGIIDAFDTHIVFNENLERLNNLFADVPLIINGDEHLGKNICFTGEILNMKDTTKYFDKDIFVTKKDDEVVIFYLPKSSNISDN